MRRLAAVTALATLAAGPSVGVAQVTSRDSAQLVAMAQLLMDAITTGDTAVWARHIVPTWFIADEEGRIIPRKEFLETLKPLPPGQSGTLTVLNPTLVGARDVAVISYDIDEVHHFYDQLLLTRFHATDTYVRRGGRWVQQASHLSATPRPIPGIRVPQELARTYAGTYRLTPDITLSIAPRDSGLVMTTAGRPEQRLHALDDRMFIRHGVRGFWVFQRDSTGMVKRLTNWRDNNAVVWTREP